MLLPQRTGQIEQPHDTRTIDLSCKETEFCPLESGISKPHGRSACAKLRRAGRSTQAASTALTSVPHQLRIPKLVLNPNHPDHTAKSHDSGEGQHDSER